MPNNGTTSRPRVLFVSHETTLSGAPIQLVHLASWLQEHGWDILVATPDYGPISDMLIARRVPTVVETTLLTDLAHVWLREQCRRFDVIVANTIASWPAIRAARQERKPSLWYLHETLVAIRLIRAIPEMASALTMADLLVTPTRQTARIYRGLTEAPIEVVPYGIPRPQTVSSEPGEQMRFLTLASFEPRKGQDVLAEAIRKLDATVRERCQFKMAGRALDEEFYAELQKAVAGFPEVELIDALDHADALKLLNETDVLVLPSRDETMPIAILEAIGLSKAVISADVGGVREWVRDEMNGLLVERENVEALAEAITKCATDPRLVERLKAAAARTFERHFTLDVFAARFAELLISLEQQPRKHGREYADWVAQFDTLTDTTRASLRRELRLLPRQPLISIVLPVYNPDLHHLKAAIDSVRHQIYERWELCIADDASTDPKVRPFLEEIARGDARVKLTLRESNGHIPACSNSALEMATGEMCALLDQDDLFAENALALVALELARHPDAGLIYSDEDKVDEAGERSNPFFKPDWNPELFLGQNYINHLGVYRTELLRRIGGFRQGFEGSQDYDLALRCVELLEPGQVRHIPKILYHWRAVAGSLAAVPDAKPYAKHAARRAIADYLRRKQQPGRVVRCPENIESHRAIYEVPTPAPLVSVIIPTRDRADLLELCVKSVRERTDYAPVEVLIVDNDSVEPETDELLSQFESEKIARVLRDRGTFNYSRLNNLAAAQASGEILLFLNNDIEVENRAWLTEMVSHAARSEVGAVGARLWYPDGTLQHGGVVLGMGGLASHAFPRIPRGHPGYYNRAFLQQDCSAVTGACMAMRKKVFREFNGFDEEDLGVNFSDIDLCLRLRAAGYEIVWTPYANLIHRESASRGYQRTEEQQEQFLREANYMRERWGAELLHDPFYNPNFTLNPPGFEIAFPPRLPQAMKLWQ
ncbi:MAG TPA: glycosyltransferase [Chthoniobacterales bacterium]|jgi:glycosyltransferase involved in cell wall biosynthesis|nr:glycosyltransferase [Chthoniobacterales bacterium]